MERAVTIVDLILKKYGAPIYVRHQIVHNAHVVSDFEKRGVIFVEDLNLVPDGSIVVFSAHGSPPDFYQKAKKKNLRLFDAVCPLVTKVHIEAKRYEKEGYFIFYVGHRRHPEPAGVIGEVSPKSIVLIENARQAKKVNPPQEEKLIVLTQTTLSFDDTKEIINILKKRFHQMILPPAFDICYATQNRQNAVKELAKKVDLVLVIGSKESSNSNRLRDVAKKEGVNAYLINDVIEIKENWLKKVEKLGITAGASAPENIIQSVIKYFSNDQVETEELQIIREKVYFPLPNL